MGTLFKRGEQWVAQFFDGAGDRRQVSTKTSDRRAAERILAKLEAEAALRREGVIDARADGFATGERTPLATHVENYLAHCQAAGMDELHVENKRLHLARFRDDSKLLRLSEVTAEAVSRFLRSLTVPKLNDAKATVRKAVSARTVNAHRADIIAFIAWTERNGLTPDKRLSGLVPKLDENADRRKVRRALTSGGTRTPHRGCRSARTCGVVPRGDPCRASSRGLGRADVGRRRLRCGVIDDPRR
jgi:hypothetical protein